MQVRVLLFGMLKDVMGKSSDSLTLPENASVKDLLNQYSQDYPKLAELMPSLAVSVNRDYALAHTLIHEGDEIALLPPVSGGSDEAEAAEPAAEFRCALVRHEIDIQEVIDEIKKPSDGALSLFVGIVRDNSRGRPTLHLDYEAYEPMALKQMEALASRAAQKFAVSDVSMIHRLGRLQIGESSILIAVASAHRRQGLDACSWLIDTFKKTIPVWKKEYFVDGALWSDGEAFPPELSLGSKPAAPASNPLPASSPKNQG